MNKKQKYYYVVTFDDVAGFISRWRNGKPCDYKELPVGFRYSDLRKAIYYFMGSTNDGFWGQAVLRLLYRTSSKNIEKLMLSFRLTDEPIRGKIGK